jgi:FkbM family methyltransferase
MSTAFKIASALDSIGLRKPLARAATLAYPASTFSVDARGRWVNRQPEATFVNTSLHTTSYNKVTDWVLDNWAWGYMPRPGDTVIDVGAGIGEEAVVFSRMVGEAGRVISIEAHPETFSCLQETVRLSGLKNVIPVSCAVADADGELFISTAEVHLASSVLGQSDGIKVPARSLDSLADELGLTDVALLKMNIEGAEKLAVRGISRLAPSIRNAIISCHDFISDSTGDEQFRVKAEVRAALEAYGFTIRTRPDAPEPWARDYLYASR